MTQPNRISNFGSILVSEGISDSDYQRLQHLGQELEQLYDSARERAERISSNQEYTSRGKNRRKAILTREIAESLEKYAKLASKPMEMVNGPSWALELKRLQEQMHNTTQPKLDPVLVELRNQERRQYLMSLDPNMREAAIRSAAERGDYSLLDSVTSGFLPSHLFLLDKTREILESKRLESLNPAATRRIREIERSQRTLRSMVHSLKQSLLKAGLFEEQQDQPIQFLNAG